MEKIIWNNSFSVGIREIDNQHYRLVEMINQLIDEQKQVTDYPTIADMLTKMTDYAREHFRDEEYLMAEYGYDMRDTHIQSHEAFIATTLQFMSAEAGPNYLSKALLEYLKS